MPKPSIRAIQRLHAMSGNRCAFSSCTAPIIEDSLGMAGINMDEIGHIRAIRRVFGHRETASLTLRIFRWSVHRHGS